MELCVAVKVLQKFADNNKKGDNNEEQQGSCLTMTLQKKEIDNLRALEGGEGVVQLLAVIETTFDLQLVFPYVGSARIFCLSVGSLTWQTPT